MTNHNEAFDFEDEDYVDVYPDLDEVCEVADVCDLTGTDAELTARLGLRLEKIELTLPLELGFVVNELSRQYSRKEPVEATVKATVGLIVRDGWFYREWTIDRLSVKFANGRTKAYSPEAIDNDCDLETIAIEFYDELREACNAVKQSAEVEKMLLIKL